MLIYANCNVHDCSWSNRPNVLSRGELEKEAEFKAYRTKWICFWVLCNVIFAYFFQSLSHKGYVEFVVVILMIGFFMLVIRAVFSFTYLIRENRLERLKVKSTLSATASETEEMPLKSDDLEADAATIKTTVKTE